MANFESCHNWVTINFHWKFFQVQARSLLQILNGFLVGFTLGGSACFRVKGNESAFFSLGVRSDVRFAQPDDI